MPFKFETSIRISPSEVQRQLADCLADKLFQGIYTSSKHSAWNIVFQLTHQARNSGFLSITVMGVEWRDREDNELTFDILDNFGNKLRITTGIV